MRFLRCAQHPLIVMAVMIAAVVSPLRGQSSPAGAPPAAVVMQAKVSKEAATATAVRQVASGRLQSIGLGMVAGKLAYTAFVTVTGKPGRTTVIVDATTGAVLSKRP
jgi:uncharacterized membrane protein YkoI